MAQTSGFFNAQLDSQGNFDRVYLAEQFASYFSNFIGNGVFAHLLDKFVVTTGGGLSVNVGTGKAFVKGFWFESDAQETLSIDIPDGLLNRKDNIVIRFDFENRTTGLYVVKGVAATTPIAPSVTRNSLVFELKIAEVFVHASRGSISQSAITDTRSDNNVCGWVTGLINQVNTSDLFLQYSKAYQEAVTQMQSDEQRMMEQMNAWYVSQKTAFDTWMSTLTEELNVDGYLVEANLLFSTSEAIHSKQMFYIQKSLLPNKFVKTKKVDFVELFVNGLKVLTYELGFEPSIPNGTYYATYQSYDDGDGGYDIEVSLHFKDTSGQIYDWGIMDQEVIVKVCQFRKGIHS